MIYFRASSVLLELPFLLHAPVVTMVTPLVLKKVTNAHLAQQVSTVLAMDLKNQLDLVMQASIAVEELALL